MATVQSIIDSARYDLGDYQEGIVWDNAELLNYLNRMVGILDSQLASLNSDLVEAEETGVDCTEDQNYVDLSAMNSDLWDSVRAVWIGENRLTKVPLDNIRYKRMFRDSSAEPRYWALSNRNLMFECDSDDDYDTLVIQYNKKTDTLALTDSMPFDDIFNETLRELLVLYAMARKEGGVSKVNSMLTSTFRKRAVEEELRRGFIPRNYHIDW